MATESTRTGGNCQTSYNGQARGQTIAKVDNIRFVSVASSLVEDADADNDGVPNYIDASPLNAVIHGETTLPVNNTYNGGQVREVQSRQ